MTTIKLSIMAVFKTYSIMLLENCLTVKCPPAKKSAVNNSMPTVPFFDKVRWLYQILPLGKLGTLYQLCNFLGIQNYSKQKKYLKIVLSMSRGCMRHQKKNPLKSWGTNFEDLKGLICMKLEIHFLLCCETTYAFFKSLHKHELSSHCVLDMCHIFHLLSFTLWKMFHLLFWPILHLAVGFK